MRCAAATRVTAADRYANLKHKQVTTQARFEYQNVSFELLTLKNIKKYYGNIYILIYKDTKEFFLN